MPELPFNFHSRFGEARDSLRDRVRRAVAPSNLWAICKSLLWLAPLTILIWYTAESSRRVAREIVNVPIEVVSTDPLRVATLLNPSDARIRVSIYGTVRQVEQFDSLARAGMTLRLTDTSATGTVVRLAEPLLSATDTARETGVTLLSVTPRELRLAVEEVVEREVPIQPPPSVQNLQSAVFDPPNVKLRGPSSVIEAAEASQTLVAYADIARLPILQQPGIKEPRPVGLTTPLPGVTIAPSTVTATLHVRESDVQYTITSMPVFVSLPPGVMEEMRITVEPDNVYNVPVFGPPEQVALLREDKFRPIARLDFQPSDINAIRNGQSGAKKPTFVIPEGVQVDPETLRNTTLNWSAQRRGG